MGAQPASHESPLQDLSNASGGAPLSDRGLAAPPGTSNTDDAAQSLDPTIYGGDFVWVGKHYKLKVPKGPSPLQWVNGFAKRFLVLHDIVLSEDGTFCRPGKKGIANGPHPLANAQGIDLRWRWDAAQDRLVVDFWNKGKLIDWRWDDLRIKDNTKVVPDFAGVGHFGKFTYNYELIAAPADSQTSSSELNTERRLILNLEPVTRNGKTFPWLAEALKQQRENSGIDDLGSLFAVPPIEAQLGTGTYGSVWLARDRETGEYFAVKNMAIARSESNASMIAQNEVGLIEKLSTQPHPCIVHLFAVEYFEIRHSGMYMLIMEFCSGGDLQEALDSHVGVDQSYKPPEDALRWVGQVFSAIEHVHTKLNLLIRDLKPGCVGLSGSRCAKLTDFGYGRLVADSPGGQWSYVVPPGTPGYIAPELLSKEAYSYPVDIYSFGVLTWVVLSGGLKDAKSAVPPTAGFGFDFSSYGSDWSLLHSALENPETAKCLLPANATEVIAAMTSERPQERPDWQALRKFQFFCEQCSLESGF